MRHISLQTSASTWECDENAHMNVQFYFAKFDDANRIFCNRFPIAALTRQTRLTRHVRYHREAYAAGMIEVRSALVLQEGCVAAICHYMIDPAENTLLATALDTYQPHALDQVSGRLEIPSVSWSEIPDARPRGLPLSPASASKDEKHQTQTPTYQGIFHPMDFAADGVLLDRAFVSCFTKAAPHSWAAGGITPDFLTRNNYGRVAVEMKLTYGAEVEPGAVARMTTAFRNVGRTTFTVRHTLTVGNRVIAYCDLVSLMMDLDLRKAVALPPEADRMRHLAEPNED